MVFPLTTGTHDFVLDSFGHSFVDTALLNKALDYTGLRFPESNQRLAMLGDALLRFIILDTWYAGGSCKGEGNVPVSTLGSNSNLVSTGRDIGLNAYIVLNPGHRGEVSHKTMATTVEAILGAIYLDTTKDLDTVGQAMQRLEVTTEEP